MGSGQGSAKDSFSALRFGFSSLFFGMKYMRGQNNSKTMLWHLSKAGEITSKN